MNASLLRPTVNYRRNEALPSFRFISILSDKRMYSPVLIQTEFITRFFTAPFIGYSTSHKLMLYAHPFLEFNACKMKSSPSVGCLVLLGLRNCPRLEIIRMVFSHRRSMNLSDLTEIVFMRL